MENILQALCIEEKVTDRKSWSYSSLLAMPVFLIVWSFRERGTSFARRKGRDLIFPKPFRFFQNGIYSQFFTQRNKETDKILWIQEPMVKCLSTDDWACCGSNRFPVNCREPHENRLEGSEELKMLCRILEGVALWRVEFSNSLVQDRA